MKTILVTGGAGFIGAHLVNNLLKEYNVVIVDTLRNIGGISYVNPKAEFIDGDIRSHSDLESVFLNHKISSIIHMAAFKDIGESMENPSKYTENNIVGSLNLISSVIKFKVDKFIFSSTAAVYGNPEFIPIDMSSSLSVIA